VSVFPDDLIEDVAGVDDVKLPSETTITSFFPRVWLDAEEGARDATIGSNNVLNALLLN
jgi:hypothetical protein